MCHVLGSISWAGVGHFLSALMTPLIGAIAVSIAWQQYVVNRRQHRLALFEKRMAIFNSTMKMIAYVIQDANGDLNKSFNFVRETRDHEFLFEKEVSDYINKVYKKALELRTYILVNPSSNAAKQTEVMTWFLAQASEARNVFMP